MMQKHLNALEKIETLVLNNAAEACRTLAADIAHLIREKAARQEKCVLGLATGSTPVMLYEELVRLHKKEGLSFSNVVTFNLDEYYPIAKNAYQSYWSFMQRHLLSQVDIPASEVHIPEGNISRDRIRTHCLEYEEAIERAGGIDLQILGIGQNGHIGFNEPGSSIHSKTRLITLDNSTRMANSPEFQHISQVPRMAITMGMSTILKARRVVLLAWGNKAPVVARAVEGPVTEQLPASLLQQHPYCQFIIDKQAAQQLTRYKSPWLAADITWSPELIKRAVVNLALKLGKPVLNLGANDYNEHGLADLLVDYNDAYEINLSVFYQLRDSITGWPGGKNAPLPNPPERMDPWPKKCLIFSPHPDDDIISMGGTFQRLHDQGHEVHVAYQTSGNIAVTDEFVTRYLDFVVGFEDMFGINNETSAALLREAKEYLGQKESGDPDSSEIRAIKGLIRRGEAAATCRYVGLQPGQWHFQNLPFYETGLVEKNPMSPEDVKLTKDLLKKIRPHQVFAAGDLADPHGTHKVCLDVVITALQELREEGETWINECWLWLYKGAWQEWAIEEIEMAIPMSPDQVLKKRFGIFIHQSQKDMVPFQGSDSREFWQRAEERNAATAQAYAALGLTQYAAMEAFRRYYY